MTCRALVIALVGTLTLGCGCGGGGGNNIPVCGAFSPCGGDLTGKWTLDGICTEGDIFGSFMDTTDLPPECKNLVQSVSMNMSGTIEYANGVETSDVNMSMNMRFSYTSACLSAEAGTTVTMTQAICDSMVSSMTSDPDAPKVTCSFSGGNCNCVMTMTNHAQETASYTVNGNTFTYEDGDEVEFCVSGSSLTMRQASDGQIAMQMKAHRQ
jgi:hypothetical protein